MLFISITRSMHNAIVLTDPFAHFFIDDFASAGDFEQLSNNWPEGELAAVPGSDNVCGRRSHKWLTEHTNWQRLAPMWADLYSYSRSEEAKRGFEEMTERMNVPLQRKTEIWVRLCEESLPFVLAPHLDHPDKLLSVIWYMNGKTEDRMGTDLYSADGSSRRANASANKALGIANSANSYHGGDWSRNPIGIRRTIQFFYVSPSILNNK